MRNKDELLKLINSLENDKSHGFDNIDHLKRELPQKKLKIAKTVPILKGGDSSLPSNYRPIFLIREFDKLLEKLIAI